jgi:hypothetical protein
VYRRPRGALTPHTLYASQRAFALAKLNTCDFFLVFSVFEQNLKSEQVLNMNKTSKSEQFSKFEQKFEIWIVYKI